MPARLSKGNGQSAAALQLDVDPFEAVLGFGRRAVRTGLIAGLVIAALSHGAFGGRAVAAPVEMQRWAVWAREEVHAYLWAAYDVEVVKPDVPKPDPPKPNEEKKDTPEDNTPAVPQPAARPADNSPPPPPAAAGKILTAGNDGPVDLTDPGFVTGDAPEYIGGVTSPTGTGSAANYNPNTTPTSRGTGTGAGPTAAPVVSQVAGPDLSRPAKVANLEWSSCSFPPEADTDQVDYAVVRIMVTVRPDGSPQSVKVLSDPGHGFGRAARMCALSKRYSPAFDRSGTAISGTTAPFPVTFTR